MQEVSESQRRAWRSIRTFWNIFYHLQVGAGQIEHNLDGVCHRPTRVSAHTHTSHLKSSKLHPEQVPVMTGPGAAGVCVDPPGSSDPDPSPVPDPSSLSAGCWLWLTFSSSCAGPGPDLRGGGSLSDGGGPDQWRGHGSGAPENVGVSSRTFWWGPGPFV